MAINISKTPTLRGKEADSFQREAAKNCSKTADRSVVMRALKTFEAVSRKQSKTKSK